MQDVRLEINFRANGQIELKGPADKIVFIGLLELTKDFLLNAIKNPQQTSGLIVPDKTIVSGN